MKKGGLKIQIEAVIDDVYGVINELGKLQKYKLGEGDDMTLVDVDEVADVLTRHVKAREAKEPSIDAVKHGRWKYISFLTVECSECKAQIHDLEYSNFCPNCGSKMDETVDE